MSNGPREIIIGRKRMADVRHLFEDTVPRTRRPDGLRGIAIHHDGVLFDEGDMGPPTGTLDEDLRRLEIIYRTAIGRGLLRFPYHFVASPHGRLFYTLDLEHRGSHVAMRNDELIGVALLGLFTEEPPADAALCAAGSAVAAIWHELGRLIPLRAHREWSLAGHATQCPGDTWPDWSERLLALTAYHATNNLH